MHVRELTRLESNTLYQKVLEDNDFETMRWLCLNDLFFLISIGCRRPDINREWIFQRCREVEAAPDGYIDLWFREGYKSTIITFGKTIQDILQDPEETFGILSHTRPIAKAFLFQIKTEFEVNKFLKGLFPEVLYAEPERESPKWSLDDGIIVKRKSNPKESTIEAWGLVDGQPTSKHFGTSIYDDIVVRESVGTTEMIQKTTSGWELSINLGAARVMPDGKERNPRRRYTGTRYHHDDTYKVIIDRGSAIPRMYFPTDKGQKDIAVEGKSVLFSQELLINKRKSMGIYTYGCQMLQDPTADRVAGFNLDWWMSYTNLSNYSQWNFYLICDPASEKKKDSDYTVMLVIGLAPDNNYYLVDGIRARMNLTERAKAYINFHRKWKSKASGYEKYGMQCDIEHIKYEMEQQNYRFEIVPLGGNMSKPDRIRRLVPIFEQHRWYMPVRLYYHAMVDTVIKMFDLVEDFRAEYIDFPMSSHDDIMDCASRITDADLNASFPMVQDQRGPGQHKEPEYDPYKLQEA